MNPNHRITSTVIATLATFATIAGFVLTALGTAALLAAIIVGALAGAAQIWLLVGVAHEKTYSFKNDTDPALARFFENWYKQAGNHSVFCNDLEWLDSTQMAAARQTLAQLGHRVKVYVVTPTGRACADIRDAGGSIYLIPAAAMSDRAPRMSLVEDGDTQIAAIRFKDSGGSRVQFKRTSDNTALSLAKAYIYAAKPEMHS